MMVVKLAESKSYTKLNVPLYVGIGWNEALYERTQYARRIRERYTRSIFLRPTLFIVITTTNGEPTGLTVFTSEILSYKTFKIFLEASKYGELTEELLLDNMGVIQLAPSLHSDLRAAPALKNSYLFTKGCRQEIYEFSTASFVEAEQILEIIFEPGKITRLKTLSKGDKAIRQYKIVLPLLMQWPYRFCD